MNALTLAIGARVRVNCAVTDRHLRHHAAGQHGRILSWRDHYQVGDFDLGHWDDQLCVYLCEDREIVHVRPRDVTLEGKA